MCIGVLFLDSGSQYMIILFMVFIVQFSVSSACLAINKDQQVGTQTAVNHNLRLGARGTKPTFQTKPRNLVMKYWMDTRQPDIMIQCVYKDVS